MSVPRNAKPSVGLRYAVNMMIRNSAMRGPATVGKSSIAMRHRMLKLIGSRVRAGESLLTLQGSPRSGELQAPVLAIIGVLVHPRGERGRRIGRRPPLEIKVVEVLAHCDVHVLGTIQREAEAGAEKAKCR